VTDQSAQDLTKSAEQTGSPTGAQPEPPAANQAKDEPIATTPDESAQGSSGGPAAETTTAASMPASATGGVPTPGDSHGVAVPAVQAALGTSEQAERVDGVKITSLAPPGKPDGEVDTRA
jgi:hypothetical protein